MQILPKMLEQKYGFPNKKATKIFTLPYLICALMSPFLGLFSDKKGYRVNLSKNIVLLF